MGLLDFLRSRPAAEQPKETSGPKGGSGRGHTNGFLEFEELNQDLIHPTCHEVYDRMYRTDGDVRQVVSLVSNPMIAGTWSVDPFGGQEASDEDAAIAEQVRWALWDYMRPNLIGHLIEFLPLLFRSGFAPGEIVWAMTDYPGSGKDDSLEIEAKKLLAPKTIQVRLPRSVQRWFQDKDGELTGIEQYLPSWRTASSGGSNLANHDWRTGDPRTGTTGGGSGINTVTIERKNLVYYRIGAEGDNWEGQSLLRPAYKHWFYKDRIERLDAIAQEREAMGIPVMYMPPTADPDQVADMEAALRDMRTNDVGYIMIPGMKAGSGAPEGTGWLFEIMGYDRTGSGRDPGPSLEYHTQKIAAAFIAEFMRLGHGESGARATAQVQADPFQMSVEALVTQVEQVLNDAIVAPFVAYNFAEVKNPPKLKMSLVDSTSLSQLADFVLKLTQVGALLPDQELEDFLRARADLPPANAEAVRDRADDEEMVRRMIVGGNIQQTPADEAAEAAGLAAGAANNDDPFGSNAKVGKHKNGKPAGSPQRKAGAPKGPAGRGKGAPRGAAKTLDELPSYALLDAVDVDIIRRTLDDCPVRLEAACSPHIYGVDADTKKLTALFLDELEYMYGEGRAHVGTELGMSPAGLVALDRGSIDRGGELQRRAELAAETTQSIMRHAHAMEDINSGVAARAKLASEDAGRRTVRRMAQGHGSDAYQHGRHDMALDAGDAIMGAAYTCILDDNSCPECERADDGQVRPLDDPIRLDRRPPNHHCDSTASGQNLCRCFELYFPVGPGDTTLTTLDATPTAEGPAPELIQRIVNDLVVNRGMETHRAFNVALQRARLWARGGGRISPKTQAEAAEAMRQWDAQA